MKKILLATALTVAISSSAQADTLLGLYVGGQIWATEASGSFGDSNDQAEFTFEDQKQGSFYAAFEHPLPLIPNVRISHTTLDTTGVTTLPDDFDFRGEVFDIDSEVSTQFDLTYMDYTLYYEFFDNDLVSFDLGITGRDFDTDITVSQDDNSSTLRATGIIPMLYAYTNIGLPFTGFNIYGEGNFLSLGDHSLYDLQVGVSYEMIDNIAIDVNLTVGYRAVHFEIDDLDDLHSVLDFEGLFVGAVVHF